MQQPTSSRPSRPTTPTSGSASLSAPPKVSPAVYMELHRISLLGDLALYMLCSSLPPEPIAGIADFFSVLSKNEKTHTQIVEPPRPPLLDGAPAMRAYLQQHRVAFLMEEWIGELCAKQPETPLQFSSAYFQRMLVARVRKGVPLPVVAAMQPAPAGVSEGGASPQVAPPPSMNKPSENFVTMSGTLTGSTDGPVNPAASDSGEVRKTLTAAMAPPATGSRPPSAVSDRSSLSPLQSRDEIVLSPVPGGAAAAHGRSLSPLTPVGSPGGTATTARRAKILILVYSHHGHCEALAFAAMDGVMRNPVMDGYLYRFPETLRPEELAKMGIRTRHPDDPGCIPEFEDLASMLSFAGFIFIFPTRFGGVPTAVQTFMDRFDGQLLLANRVAGVMVSTASQHGGQERTIRAFQNGLLQLGMILVGTNPKELSAVGETAVCGGSPYGASTITGADGSRFPSEEELKLASSHAGRVASFAAAMHRHS